MSAKERMCECVAALRVCVCVCWLEARLSPQSWHVVIQTASITDTQTHTHTQCTPTYIHRHAHICNYIHIYA